KPTHEHSANPPLGADPHFVRSAHDASPYCPLDFSVPLSFPSASPRRATKSREGSGHELLGEDPLLEVVLGIEQQGDGPLAGLPDRDFDYIPDPMRVGGGTDRALVRVQDPEPDLGDGLEHRSPPASRTEGGD